MAVKRRKRRVKRRTPTAKDLGRLRQVFFNPKTGAKLKGFHVMTPSGLVIKVNKSMFPAA